MTRRQPGAQATAQAGAPTVAQGPAPTAAQAREWALQEGPLDYAAIGFRCGLEIHQQLATRKLHSPCPGDVVDPEAVSARTVARVDRRLRATQSELGESDPAAVAEGRRQKAFRYLVIDGLSSLVELDEEPPWPMSPEALQVALEFAGLLGSHPAAEVHSMRKTVIDGSNTSGFQRTALVATGGSVDVGATGTWPEVGVWTIALEEDSARKVEDEEGTVTYTLDRLGIPLIEVATAPDIVSPAHAQATAARIGALLRATGKVRRGLGSIRQDLNVSVGVGRRVEIKGCQDLRAVPDVIDRECRRQLWLWHIAQDLRSRGFTSADVGASQDVSGAFEGTKAKVVAAALARKQAVLGMRLAKWGGLLSGARPDAPRMGRELADHAAVAAGVKGIFHSDELPAYGIGPQEVQQVRTMLGAVAEDAFVLCVERPAVAARALEAVAARAVAALEGAGSEVRAAQADNTTRYMRPMPGAARMYPETDVPPTPVPAQMWQRVLAELPLRPEQQAALLQHRHGVSTDVASQLVASGDAARFGLWVEQGVEPALAARILMQYLPGLGDPERVARAVPDLAGHLSAGRFAKEALPAILAALDQDGSRSVEDAVAAAGVAAVDEGEVARVVAQVVAERLDFVRQRGMAALGPLMGPVMEKLRGKADGKAVADVLRSELARQA